MRQLPSYILRVKYKDKKCSSGNTAPVCKLNSSVSRQTRGKTNRKGTVSSAITCFENTNLFQRNSYEGQFEHNVNPACACTDFCPRETPGRCRNPQPAEQSPQGAHTAPRVHCPLRLQLRQPSSPLLMVTQELLAFPHPSLQFTRENCGPLLFLLCHQQRF